MAIFIYEAVNKKGQVSRGEINAVNQEEVVANLLKKRLTPVVIEDKRELKHQLNTALFERFTSLDRIIIIRNLSATLRAGLSLNEALDILIADASKQVIADFLTAAKVNVLNGQQLSKTFEQHPKLFSPIIIGMIKAGEISGQLDKTLNELSQHMIKEHNLVKKVKSALAYPAILLVASIGIVVLLLVFVLPRLTKTFAQSKVDLPIITKILVKLSEIITFNFYLDFGFLVLVFWFFSYFRKTNIGHRFFARLLFFFPASRNLVKKIVLVRLTRTLSSLIASALPISESLELTASAVGNEYYARAVLAANEAIRSGMQLSESFRKYPKLFPRFLTSLVAVGEKTGTLEEVLKTFADFYEEEADGALKDLTTFLEPVMLLIMGLIVGLIAVSILMPIYQLVGNFV